MLEPEILPVTIWIGSSFDQEFQFWADDANTVPYDFTPWTVTAELLSANIKNSGTPLDVNIDGGTVTLSLSWEQTSALIENTNTRYVIAIELTGDPTVNYYVVTGDVTFKSL